MKKFLAVFFTVLWMVSSASTVMAQTIDVDVNPGFTLGVEKDFLGSEDWRIMGNLGLTDQFLFKISYAGDSETFGLGGRYEISTGRAVVFDYYIDGDDNRFDIGLRDRLSLRDSLALVGELLLVNNRVKDSISGDMHGTVSWTYTLQLQQKFSQQWAGNLDVAYFYSHGDTDILGAIGADYLADGFKVYLNYHIYPDNDENTLTAGIEIGL